MSRTSSTTLDNKYLITPELGWEQLSNAKLIHDFDTAINIIALCCKYTSVVDGHPRSKTGFNLMYDREGDMIFMGMHKGELKHRPGVQDKDRFVELHAIFKKADSFEEMIEQFFGWKDAQLDRKEGVDSFIEFPAVHPKLCEKDNADRTSPGNISLAVATIPPPQKECTKFALRCYHTSRIGRPKHPERTPATSILWANLQARKKTREEITKQKLAALTKKGSESNKGVKRRSGNSSESETSRREPDSEEGSSESTPQKLRAGTSKRYTDRDGKQG